VDDCADDGDHDGDHGQDGVCFDVPPQVPLVAVSSFGTLGTMGTLATIESATTFQSLDYRAGDAASARSSAASVFNGRVAGGGEGLTIDANAPSTHSGSTSMGVGVADHLHRPPAVVRTHARGSGGGISGAGGMESPRPLSPRARTHSTESSHTMNVPHTASAYAATGPFNSAVPSPLSDNDDGSSEAWADACDQVPAIMTRT
jgi:hypothetical protein